MENLEEIQVDFEDGEDTKLESFSNRLVPARIFIEALHNDANTGAIIYFHGNGGNGKSLLLAYLQKNFCKRVDNATWQTIKGFDDKSLRDKLLEIPLTSSEAIPSVLVDFGEPTYEVQPQNPLSATCYMRKLLAGKGLKFELFDYAYVLYLSRTGNLNEREIKNVICDGAIDGILELARASVEVLPGSSLALKLLQRIIGSKMYLYFKSRNVDEQFLQQLRNIKSNSELENRMPYLFALDLMASMQSSDAPARLALFFDTHEKFWLAQRDLSPFDYFRRDAWLRILLNVLSSSERIVTVVAGRELPRWSEASKNAIPAEKVTTHQIGLISLADARESLEKRGITDGALRESIVRFTEVECSEVHPMYLGICADAVQSKLEKGIAISPDEFKDAVSPEKLGEEVLHRLLSDVSGTLQPAIVALSVCRSFNYTLYRELAQNNLGSSGERAVFEQVLTKYSFIKKLSAESFQVHQLIRKLIEEIPVFASEIRTARKVLENYFRSLARNGDDVALTEAIYYANQLDAERGQEEWLDTFRNALDQCQWFLCNRLGELSRELTFTTEVGLVKAMHLMGRYYQKISRYTDAQASYLNAVNQIDILVGDEQKDADLFATHCDILNDMVELLSFLSEHEKAEVCFQKALAAYEKAMQYPGCSASVYNGKSELFNVYGYAKQRVSDLAAAEKLYVDAAEVGDQALVIDRNNVDGHSRKARALRRLSDLMLSTGRGEAALEAGTTALACVEKALRLQPGLADLYCVKGVILDSIGNIHDKSGRVAEAQAAFDESIKCFDQSLAIVPKNADAIFPKGCVYDNFGEMLSNQQAVKEAEAAFEQAIACYGEALNIAPQDAWVHSRQATVLMKIGNCRGLENKPLEALVFYQSALKSLDNALKISPNETWILNSKGSCLVSLGSIQMGSENKESAVGSFQVACSCFDSAISLIPQFIDAHLNKGYALRNLGKLVPGLSAIEQFRQSVECFHRASEIESKNIDALSGKGTAFLDLAEIQGITPETALSYVTQAVECFDKILLLNPRDSDAHLLKGWAFLQSGRILKAEGGSAKADVAYGEAINIYRQILRVDPGNENANSNIKWILSQIEETKLKAKLAANLDRDYVAPHNLEEEKRYRRPLDLGLTQVDREAAIRFLADIYAPESPDQSEVQAAILPFYKEYHLYQYTDKSVEPAAVYYYLYKSGDARLLDWTGSQIITNDALIVTRDTLIPYARFTFYFTRNKEAQFILAEFPEDIVWRSEAAEQESAELYSYLEPLALVEEDDDGFWLIGTILINDALLKTHFLIPKKTVSILNQMTNQLMEFPRGFILPVNEQFLCKNLQIARSSVSEKYFENFFKAARAAVTPHDLKDEGRYRVPLDLGLAPVEGNDARRFLMDIFAPESPESSEVQAAVLPYYEEYRLFQYTDKTATPAAVYYYLYKSGDARLLNWSNVPIYLLNQTGALKLTEETVIDYAKFFFYFVRGYLGMFIIVEKPQDLIWLPEATNEEKAAVENHLMPVTNQGIDDHQRYVLTCSVFFKDALFRTDILIAQDAIKIFDPETNEEEEQHRGQLTLTNEELLLEEQSVYLQPPPNSVKERMLAAQKARVEVWSHHPETDVHYRMLPICFVLSPVSESSAIRFLEDIYAPEPFDLSGVLAARLPFFKRRMLFQYTVKTTEHIRVYFYLYKPGDAKLLTWAAEPIIEAMSIDEVILEPDTILTYVRFHHHFVRNQASNFILIERPDDIFWRPEATAEDKALLNKHLMQLTYLGIDDKYYLLKETGFINNKFFCRELRIPSEDMTIINPDSNLPMELKRGMVIPSNEQLIAEDLKITLPDFDIGRSNKIRRNELCPCGSGKKYKNCCGSIK
ncbi:MAG: SEC-C domain-containing protein [Methylobacter sp.]|jgi:tetratricopeptide (TPR) repeat protein|nr:SEC-C domain-containing protein [Methylobacter sp.]